MPAVTHGNVVDLLVQEIGRMAGVCRDVDPATPVPSCPEWDLAELMRHTGTVHRWAGIMVERRAPKRLRRDELELGAPEDPALLAAWLADGATFLADRFTGIDTDADMWAWGWPKSARFWPRRMLHETGIHRADAELATGATPRYDAGIAADGVDELLDNLPHALYFAPKVAELKGDGETLAFVAHDAPAAWTVELQPDGFRWTRSEARAVAADALLSTTASELLLTLYGRRPIGPGEVTGDPTLVERWTANSSL
jgi:uncharacterized protein (TIGR03083 family)